MPSLLSTIHGSLLRLAFPLRCHCCSSEVKEPSLGVACSGCWEDTTIFDGSESVCPKCGSVNESSHAEFACGSCASHFYDRARASGVYEMAMRSTLLQLKKVPVIPKIFHGRIEFFADQLNAPACDVIVPVPLSPQRRTDRGFNQAEVIASLVGKIVNKPVDTMSLIRRKHSPMHRAAMDRKAREKTVENAFSVTRPKLIDGRNVLLVDDIFTSGATASNCSKALKKKGAESVKVLTLARTHVAVHVI